MEILYKRSAPLSTELDFSDIRWLSESECQLFNRHLALYGQKTLRPEIWAECYAEGTVYCGLFRDGEMVARACVEKYSSDHWEVGDVRTARKYRSQGFATQVSAFVLEYILSERKTATMRTEENNFAMQRVIEKLGFHRISSNA